LTGVVTQYEPGKAITIRESSGNIHTYKVRRRDVGPGVGKRMDVIVQEPKDPKDKHVSIRAAYEPGSVNAPGVVPRSVNAPGVVTPNQPAGPTPARRPLPPKK